MSKERPRTPKIIEIKKWLVETGLSQTEIARKAGVSSCHVNNVIHGRRISSKVDQTLIDLGCPAVIFEKAA